MNKYIRVLACALFAVSISWAQDDIQDDEDEIVAANVQESETDEAVEEAAEEVPEQKSTDNKDEDEYANLQEVSSDVEEASGYVDKEEKQERKKAKKKEQAKAKSRSQKGFNFGLSLTLGTATIPEEGYPELGMRSDFGAIVGYYLPKYVAIFSGVSLDLIVNGGTDGGEKHLIHTKYYSPYAERKDDYLPIKNYYSVYYNVGVPVYARFLITNTIWVQAGIMFTAEMGEDSYFEVDYNKMNMAETYDMIEEYSEDGFENGFSLNTFILDAGVAIGHLDLGLHFGFSNGYRVDTRNEGRHKGTMIDAGVNMNFWFR